jgi:tetratricopeptide (TPR) repeat protein
VPDTEVEGFFTKGLEALAEGNTLSALSYLEKAINIDNSPVISSHYAFCIAKARGQVSKAVSLCEEAIKKEPKNSLHYLNLGRIYLITNNKEDAIKTFREGLNYEANQQIIDELNRLGPRKSPIIPFLKRSNLINKYLGITLRKEKSLRIRYALISLLAVVTIASIVLILFLSEKQKIPPRPTGSKKENLVEAEHDTLHPLEPKKIPPPTEVRKETPVEVKHDTLHTLELTAEDTTWIFVNIDDRESKEMLLNQGDNIKWSAKNGFLLKIGNAGGIKLIFDGKEIGPLGEKGQAISLTLPSHIILKKDMVTPRQKAKMPKPAENKLDETQIAPAQELEEREKQE